MSATVNQARRRFLSKALINSSSKGAAVITGASSGIGAIYADQLASWSANDQHVLQHPRDRRSKGNLPKTIRVWKRPWPRSAWSMNGRNDKVQQAERVQRVYVLGLWSNSEAKPHGHFD
jgi:NAD(P)-dependent dehydrogenase (short-subunit alcohol dehydrogenase family)